MRLFIARRLHLCCFFSSLVDVYLSTFVDFFFLIEVLLSVCALFSLVIFLISSLIFCCFFSSLCLLSVFDSLLSACVSFDELGFFFSSSFNFILTLFHRIHCNFAHEPIIEALVYLAKSRAQILFGFGGFFSLSFFPIPFDLLCVSLFRFICHGFPV